MAQERRFVFCCAENISQLKSIVGGLSFSAKHKTQFAIIM